MLGVLLCSLFVLADDLTVDDNGPADFDDIARAVEASQPYDTVIVAAGIYHPFHVEHPLRIVADSAVGQRIVHGTTIIDGTADVTLVGLDFARLYLLEDPGPIVLHNCTAGEWADPGIAPAVRVQECEAVVFSHVTVRGSSQLDINDPADAVSIRSSLAVLTSCDIIGSHGYSPSSISVSGGNGGIGLHVAAGSHVHMAATSVKGGHGGEGTNPFSPVNGSGGTGIHVSDSELLVCGTKLDNISHGGFYSDPFFGGGTFPGYPLIVGDSVVRLSGVKLGQDPGPFLFGNSTLDVPPVPDPFVKVVAVSSGGATVTATFHGPMNAQLLAGMGPLRPPQDLPHALGALWFQPHVPLSMLFAVTTAGHPNAVNMLLPATMLGPPGSVSMVQLVKSHGNNPPLLIPGVFVTPY